MKKWFLVPILAGLSVLATACPATTGPGQSVTLVLPERLATLDTISSTDVDPAPTTELWEIGVGSGGTTSYVIRFAGPRVGAGEGGAPIEPGTVLWSPAAIADRAVGQSGAELVDSATGEVVCRGTATAEENISIGLWDYPRDLWLGIKFSCRDSGGAFTVPGSAGIRLGYTGAV